MNRRLTATLCVAEVLGMAGFSAFPALVPQFIAAWSLSNTRAGLISGIFFAGYMAGVPFLVSLTDRIDPRRIWTGSMLLTGLAAGGFALLANGFWTALPLQALAGLGLAGTYMPGLKILTDHLTEGANQSRYVSFYTASFSIGSGFSFLVAGEAAAWLGWRWAFGAAAISAALAIGLVLTRIPRAGAGHLSKPETRLLDFRPVFRARQAMSYVLGYAAHMWELFGLRAWLVAFLTFSQGLQPEGSVLWSATVVAAIVNLAQLPASVGGNEMAVRIGRRRWLMGIMSVSALLSLFVGFSAALPYPVVCLLCLVYGMTVAGDSAALTAGAVGAAPARYRGATLALHSTLGFGMGFLGSLGIGVVLDLVGGHAEQPDRLSWGVAFAAMGLVCALGPVAIGVLGRGRE